ncbi:MAG: energy transducer TonB [Acidobacteria bacterium]|nr:energy transducer TonB [Acidobacteriota bacterium]
MKRVPASAAVAIAILAVAIGAGGGTGTPAAHAAQRELPAEPSTERIEIEVVVTQTVGYVATAEEAPEGRTWRVRAMTTAGSGVSVFGQASEVEATPRLLDDGRVALRLRVVAFRATGAADVAIQASLDVALENGTPTIVAEAANPANDSVVTVEVTATVLDRPADESAARPVEPIRVGGDVPPPRRTHDVPPVYPAGARAARAQGVVILEATIGPTGEVVDIEVLRSVPELDEAAVTAVRQWRYEPTLVDGVAVPVLMTVTVNFTLMPRSRDEASPPPPPPPPAPGRPVATGPGEVAPSPAGGPVEPAQSPGDRR